MGGGEGVGRDGTAGRKAGGGNLQEGGRCSEVATSSMLQMEVLTILEAWAFGTVHPKTPKPRTLGNTV